MATALGADGTEVRGTWLTTTGVDHISSGRNTATTLATLRGAGLNTVYIEAWKRGAPQFASQAYIDFFPVGQQPPPPVREILDEVSLQAHRNNMAAVAWFEYGFASDAGSPLSRLSTYADSRGWLLKDLNGDYTNSNTGFVWMNPAVPEVRQLLVDMAVEAVQSFDLDGIQFDDRLAWPRSLGYDATTNAIINQRFGVNYTPNHPNYHMLLSQLQDESLDLFVEELHTALRAVDPDVWISLSPSVNGFSQANYTADWPKWVAQGYFDEVVPQVYRPSIASFDASLPSNVSPFVNNQREEDGIMGLRFNGSGADTSLPDLLAMIDSTRDAANGELGGHSIWYSDNVVDFAGDLANHYGGWVSSPNLEPGHRPDALIASELSDDRWSVTVTEEGRYRLVAKYDIFGKWRTVGTAYLRAGDVVLTPGLALRELELLRDRRPIEGDFDGSDTYNAADADLIYLAGAQAEPDLTVDVDGNGTVDIADVIAWADLAHSTYGDFNLDGVLDLDDAALLRDAYTGSLGVTLPASYGDGNLDGDGDVDFRDAVLFRRLYIDSGAEPAALDALFASIPEPAMAALIALLPFVTIRKPRPCRKLP